MHDAAIHDTDNDHSFENDHPGIKKEPCAEEIDLCSDDETDDISLESRESERDHSSDVQYLWSDAQLPLALQKGAESQNDEEEEQYDELGDF